MSDLFYLGNPEELFTVHPYCGKIPDSWYNGWSQRMEVYLHFIYFLQCSHTNCWSTI